MRRPVLEAIIDIGTARANDESGGSAATIKAGCCAFVAGIGIVVVAEVGWGVGTGLLASTWGRRRGIWRVARSGR
jgi:hypothetical protein